MRFAPALALLAPAAGFALEEEMAAAS